MGTEDGTVERNNEQLEDLEGLPGVADVINPDGLMADDLEDMERQRESGDEPLPEEEPEVDPELETEEEEGKQAPTEEESPEVFTVGDKTYTADQIRELEAGNLRQADYTKKTTEAGKIRKQAVEMRANFQNLIDEATGSNNFEQQRRQPTVRQTVTDDEFATPAEKALNQQVHSLAHEIGEIKRQGVVDKEKDLWNNMETTAENFRKANDLSDEEMGSIIGRINDVSGIITPGSLEMARRSMLDPEALRQEGVKEYLKQKGADKEETEMITAPTGDVTAPKAFDARKLSESELDKAMLNDPAFK